MLFLQDIYSVVPPNPYQHPAKFHDQKLILSIHGVRFVICD